MDPQQQFFKALAAMREGDLEGCESICQRLLGINPKEVNTLRLQAQVWHKRGELERAEAGFNPPSLSPVISPTPGRISEKYSLIRKIILPQNSLSSGH